MQKYKAIYIDAESRNISMIDINDGIFDISKIILAGTISEGLWITSLDGYIFYTDSLNTNTYSGFLIDGFFNVRFYGKCIVKKPDDTDLTQNDLDKIRDSIIWTKR